MSSLLTKNGVLLTHNLIFSKLCIVITFLSAQFSSTLRVFKILHFGHCAVIHYDMNCNF
jgi:hypothetical protein